MLENSRKYVCAILLCEVVCVVFHLFKRVIFDRVLLRRIKRENFNRFYHKFNDNLKIFQPDKQNGSGIGIHFVEIHLMLYCHEIDKFSFFFMSLAYISFKSRVAICHVCTVIFGRRHYYIT